MNFTKYFIAGKDYVQPGDCRGSLSADTDGALTLCNRLTGIGADGIFTFIQNNPKNIEINGLLQNGQTMRDFSSASICACFAAFSMTAAADITFSLKNDAILTADCDFSGNKARISLGVPPQKNDNTTTDINRRTEIGNRILTVTPIYLSGIHGVHFSSCKNQLDINYLGKYFSGISLFRKQGNFITAEKTDSATYEIDFYENFSGCPRPTLSAFLATALAAIKTGRQNFNEEIRVICSGSCVNIICRDEGCFEIICDFKKVLEGRI